ncbi:MMPL family transporter [Micromonospora sp. DSM 115977]|uniref:MMPL family transporter n=1 Tax=Micromonospora reichwaldensis TaxID=3075516 RepID=A0ABU2WS15_9ACTN|nr:MULTISPECIES: MMPL family transporter [unclassified Micromonospora]KAB1137605.1 MMPL family transporter [Micromonospora sp. AMSO12t]MDT0528707.1 MMPL family transporter [Micromonospora sp. DSM 115977]WSG04844.1 MMPL family transporter [Micromonospora sp. NBC_01740]
MFAWWGHMVVRLRWAVLAAALVLVAVGSTWGAGVFGQLTGGGFDDPASESSRAAERIDRELGPQGADLVVLWSSDTASVDQPAFRDPVTATVTGLRARSEITSVTTWYDTQAPALLSTDRRATYALIQLRAADKDDKTAAYEELRPALDAPGVRTEVGGATAALHESNTQTTKDITRAELLSMPVLLVLLVLIFGGLVAASTPLLIGGLAILGAFVTVRLVTLVTDVSVFAINVITLIGLGMAVDYSLFVVSRFREELAAGHDTPAAIRRTMLTAGRTVLVSGLTIALAMASLLIFPQAFLRSMGLGGIAAVLVAMLAALTVLPALLAVLGRRIDALRVPLPWRRGARGGRPTAGETGGAWARIAHSVMRRPVRYLVGVTVLLAVLAAPFLGVSFGGFDDRVLPPDAEPRVVSERVAAEFAGGTISPIDVLVSGASPEQAQPFADRVAAVPGVTGVQVAANRGTSTLLTVTYPGEPAGDTAQDVVRALRDLPAPDGAQVLVGGRPAVDLDLIDGLGDRLPWMALLMAAATLVLLFLAFGSLVLPVKAVLMNLVSIGASFGVVVWIFQDGHFADLLGFTPTGFIEPSNPILMLAVLFGLATDYEVFLLSRVREEWDRTGDNTASVAAGLQHTGRIITAAALLLIIVVAGFATGEMAYIKLIGIGMIVAIVVDATLVRALLVPATMRLLGHWNWWAPAPLARFHRRFGLHESAEPEPAAPETRHAEFTK